MDTNDYKPTKDLSRAATIPRRWYVDTEVFAAERNKIFWKTWQAVAHLNELQRPGDYFACEVQGEPVVLIRLQDRTLRAYSNVCRHRAHPVATGKGNRKSLQCGYHGWTYGLDGHLIAASEFDGVQDWNKSDICLPQLRTDTWGPYIFVNLDSSAPPLAEVLGDIPTGHIPLGKNTLGDDDASRSAASSNMIKKQKEMTFLSHPRRFRNDKD